MDILTKDIGVCGTIATVKYMYVSGKPVIQQVLIGIGIDITGLISESVRETLIDMLGI